MFERSWDVARIQTNPTMCQTLDFARRKWEESVEWAKIILHISCPKQSFFGKQSIISPVFAILAYKCHTRLESCWKCGFLGANCFGSPLILWAQGIFSSLDQEPDPLAYTASYVVVPISPGGLNWLALVGLRLDLYRRHWDQPVWIFCRTKKVQKCLFRSPNSSQVV